jgi:hypothetical protein
MHLIIIIAVGVFGGLWLFTRWAEWREARIERRYRREYKRLIAVATPPAAQPVSATAAPAAASPHSWVAPPISWVDSNPVGVFFGITSLVFGFFIVVGWAMGTTH